MSKASKTTKFDALTCQLASNNVDYGENSVNPYFIGL
jgi:hypothetical protein